MSLPTPDPESLEKRVGVRDLSRLGAALARVLGRTGGEGGPPAVRIERFVDAGCLACGIRISGMDLLAASLSVEGCDEPSEKLRRLRLGYCARKTCPSEFYTVRLQLVAGLDWNEIRARTESALVEGGLAPEAGTSLAEQVTHLLEDLIRRMRRPAPLAILGAVVLMFWMRSGFRVPGITPAPRVFIVPADEPQAKARPGE